MLPGAAKARDGARMARTQEPAVRRRLVAAATRLFAEKGYESASVSEIVAAAGVTKGSMYHYFQAKDDLLVEIYHRVLAMQMDRLERLAAGPGTPVGLLRTDVSADLAVHYFFGSVHHLLTWYRPDGPMNASQIGNAFAQLLIDGLTPLPAARPGRNLARAVRIPTGR